MSVQLDLLPEADRQERMDVPGAVLPERIGEIEAAGGRIVTAERKAGSAVWQLAVCWPVGREAQAEGIQTPRGHADAPSGLLGAKAGQVEAGGAIKETCYPQQARRLGPWALTPCAK